MSILSLADAEDTGRLLPLITACHAEAGIDRSEAQRREALELLFSGEVQAAVWLIGPRRAPVGYIAIAFGFSIALCGREAFIDEFYVRPAVRGRGMGGQALHLILPMLRQMGVRAVHTGLNRGNAAAARIYERSGFRARDKCLVMTRQM